MLFVGKLINLRAVKDEDIKLIAEYMSDPDLMYNLEFGAPVPQSYEMLKSWHEEERKKYRPYSRFELAIETKDGRFIGSCGVIEMDRKNRAAQVFIFIGDKEYQNKGYGTEAMKLLVDFLFEEYNANKIKLGVFSFNKRAIRSYEKCGFKTEVIQREVLYRFGTYHDGINMAILKEDYYKDRGV